MAYFLAPAAVRLRKDCDIAFPKRDKSSDGWIGDPSHAARKSEHNPCWTCSGRFYGIVRAIDIDIDDNDSSADLRAMLIKGLVGDPRIWYVISNGIIYSRTYGWRPRKYTGVNSHHKHVHASFLFEGCFDTKPFISREKPKPTKPVYLDISDLRAEMIRVIDSHEPSSRMNIPVKRYQRMMNARLGTRLTLDGKVGPETLAASARFEEKFGGEGRPRVPDSITLIRGNQGMYRLVA